MKKWASTKDETDEKPKTNKALAEPRKKVPTSKTKVKVKLKKRDSSESRDDESPKKKKKKVTMPSEKELTKAIKKILDGADLETITMKQVTIFKRTTSLTLL